MNGARWYAPWESRLTDTVKIERLTGPQLAALTTGQIAKLTTAQLGVLGTAQIAVIQHTNCGMHAFDDTAFRAQLTAETGRQPGWDVPGFTDLPASVRRTVQAIKDCPWLPRREDVYGFVYDVTTAALTEVA